MENMIQTFVNEEFGTVKTLIKDGQPWFVGKDVAVILGYNEPHKAIARRVDEDDGMKHPVIDSMGRTQNVTIVNESGFYIHGGSANLLLLLLLQLNCNTGLCCSATFFC